MSNNKIMSAEQIMSWYEKEVAKDIHDLSVTINSDDCEILPPNVDVEKVRALKEAYVKSRCKGYYKSVIVNVPLLIVYKLEGGILR